MAKLILKADSPEQELELHQGLEEHSARKILAAAGNQHFELQKEGNQRRQDKKAKKRTANIEKACRLYDQYRADDPHAQEKTIKYKIARELGKSIRTVESYLKAGRK
jgi:cysteine synthase